MNMLVRRLTSIQKKLRKKVIEATVRVPWVILCSSVNLTKRTNLCGAKQAITMFVPSCKGRLERDKEITLLRAGGMEHRVAGQEQRAWEHLEVYPVI